MSAIGTEDTPRPRIYARNVMSNCPDCDGDLTVLRVIGGRAGCEYWTMRCTGCGSIHLDILEAHRTPGNDGGPLPAA